MSLQQMRDFLGKKYPATNWNKKPDNQVIAIYHRILREGR